jgi:dCTP deaminase
MILTGDEIRVELQRGMITLDPFDPAQLNPNSYNYRLASELRICADPVLDPRQPGTWTTVQIPHEGVVLDPGRLYLGSTVERIGSSRYVASLIGRSSLGRLGMFLQTSADLGNLGATHCWTLEIKVVQRLRIYTDMLAGQVSFWKPTGKVSLYAGVYDTFDRATPYQQQECIARSEHE